MKDIHILRLSEFAKHLSKKEFLNPACFGQYTYLTVAERRGNRKFSYQIKTRKFIIDALVIFYEWNLNESSDLIYEGRFGLINNTEEGILDFFFLTPRQLSHLLDIQNGKYYCPRLFGGKKLHARSKAKDFSWNMKSLLEKLN